MHTHTHIYNNAYCCLVAKLCPTLATPRTVPCQAPLRCDPPGKNTGVGCHFLLQGIFLTQGLNQCLLFGRWVLYPWATWDIYVYICIYIYIYIYIILKLWNYRKYNLNVLQSRLGKKGYFTYTICLAWPVSLTSWHKAPPRSPCPFPAPPLPPTVITAYIMRKPYHGKVKTIQSIPRNKCTFTPQSLQCSHFGRIKESHIWHFQKLLGNLLFNPVSGEPLKSSHSNVWDLTQLFFKRKRVELEREMWRVTNKCQGPEFCTLEEHTPH